MKIPSECSICKKGFSLLNENDGGEDPAILPCGHIFGNDCIIKWMSSPSLDYSSCPCCRFQLNYPRCGHTITPKIILSQGIFAEDIQYISHARQIPPDCPRCDLDKQLAGSRLWGITMRDCIKKEIKKKSDDLHCLVSKVRERESELKYLDNLLCAEIELKAFFEERVRERHRRERYFENW